MRGYREKIKNPLLGWTLVSIAGMLSGCGQPQTSPTSRPATVTSGYTVTLDRGNNGAADAESQSSKSDTLLIPRRLSFEMAGFAKAPAIGEPLEERSAAQQAAIIEAFGRALVEARRQRGQADTDFTAQLGPRLTVRCSRSANGNHTEAALVIRGIETTFVVQNGVLQHPPRDLKLVQRIFEETNGEFSLLGTEWLPDQRVCVAKVGCYLPAGTSAAQTNNAEGQTVPPPATP